ncbi:UDP-N-acetyl-D-glucosamine 2-epimerase, UDP-hydrolysing [Thermotoga petrophila RKU-10]|uniref:UDP-N-acetyl-D-glucosamine 2-epimerase, UDP-hydrolysing n=1 Tax=Thermotoga petrophila (strain ATCC BAA-489 / DSM 13996 / JCM 10882 / RKU-10) TaxID=590168 RepID=D2C6D1_THEP2|nr:UDP-N-acetylglucosamine 2-epimerase [Thermotoga petrophila]ADA66517.1 UDP-N-acetyl-D-glucosamine 2-epimerase, UDP-hydrolysing [Thermotoga petrophila RKU-10]
MKIAFFTFTRAEYGLLRWSIKRAQGCPDFDVRVFVGGSHIAKSYGMSVNEIINDGVKIDYLVDFLLDSDEPSALSKSVGVGIVSISQILINYKPDFIVILGDRYELYVTIIPALLYRIPIIHIAGGEITEGALDEQIRHSITKLSHIHIVSNERYAENISKMGEEDWRIHVLGSPGIENIYRFKLKSIEELKEELGIDFSVPTILVTYHPVTLETRVTTEEQIENLLEALSYFKDFQIVFTAPGAEVERGIIMDKIQTFVRENPRAFLFKNLGTLLYLSIAKHSKVVVGNSSSGIIEIPSLKVPTVNIGDRQKGRIAAESVIHCGYDSDSIIKAIKKAIEDKNFIEKVKNVRNPYDPYGDGDFSGRFLRVLENISINEKLLRKELDFEVKREEWNYFLKGRED